MKKNPNNYILSLDQGTTSSRAIIFDKKSNPISCIQQEFTQFYPKPGWVEHDANEIWESQLKVAQKAIKKAKAKKKVIAIGITNQRETIVLWDKITGEPVYKAIVWQCRRSQNICERLQKQGLEEVFIKKTGLRLDPYFSGTKIAWVFENEEKIKERANKGEILFGTIDSWLIYKLTGNHYTDISNASRTLLYNIIEEKWDEELLEILEIPKQILPKVLESSDNFGKTKKELFGDEIIVSGVAGDQQASLFGHSCFKAGMAKNTYGTGCFTLLNTGDKPVWSKNNLLTTIAWKVKNKTTYALEGSVFIAGAVLQWLRDELKIIKSAPESEEMALAVDSTDGVYLVPAFTGLGAPYWDPNARATILGLTRGSNRNHIVRAALESICFQSEDLFTAMKNDCKSSIQLLKADGGASNNKFLMQFQADISNTPIILPKISEITALGVAYLAGLYVNYWKDLDEIEKIWQEKYRYNPKMENKERENLLQKWKKAIKTTREF